MIEKPGEAKKDAYCKRRNPDLRGDFETHPGHDFGTESGADGDDDKNGLRGMDLNPTTGTFLFNYEHTLTTGFAFACDPYQSYAKRL